MKLQLAFAAVLLLLGPGSVAAGEKPPSGSKSEKKKTTRPTAGKKTLNPHKPPIDCPLRKAGINPHKLKPFKKVREYIAFLERKDRARWQKPDAVIKALKLKGNETVADVGAGGGYFSFRFARMLPKGKVVALDIEPEMIRHIHHKAMTTGVRNLSARLMHPSKPNVPKTTDVVFVCNVLHHVNRRNAWLAHLYQRLKRGARLVLLEFKGGKLPKGPPPATKIPRKQLIAMVTAVGFKKSAELSKLLPYQLFLVFEKR